MLQKMSCPRRRNRARKRISLHRANNVKPDYPEDQVKRIVATFAADK